MSVDANVAARDAFTRRFGAQPVVEHNPDLARASRETAHRIMGEAEEKLFGWVYKQPGMPTYDDCKAILDRVYVERGSDEVQTVLQRFGSAAIKDLWIGLYERFYRYCKTILQYGISPTYAWTGPHDIPQAMRDRWLLLHPESDCLYEVRGVLPGELGGGEVSDVSGLDTYEQLFIKQQISGISAPGDEEEL